MSTALYVFREYCGDYEQVGVLSPAKEGGMVFSYASTYLSYAAAKGISAALPLQEEAFSPEVTRTYFENLLPEGDMREIFAHRFRLGINAYSQMLSRLNNESAGALVFCASESGPADTQSYEQLDAEFLLRFSRQPRRVALDLSTDSRLSLAGAQVKVGLYCEDPDKAAKWFLPIGSAPSTHIIKVSDGIFPHQTINEAFCLSMARHCGLDVTQSMLIPVEDADPALVVTRFDRVREDDSRRLNNLRVPKRLHQEDFCQAIGVPSYLKYEPTDGHYISLSANLINRSVANPFGDRVAFFERILFDYLVGNCDNHLKNHSLLWTQDWSTCELSPLYDITCTTMYPDLAREMGISLCASRRIDDVTADDIRRSSQDAGIPAEIGWKYYLDLCKRFPDVVDVVKDELVEQGFTEALEIAKFILRDSASRRMLG
jgi:serine/threonine-protein kinase HipA